MNQESDRIFAYQHDPKYRPTKKDIRVLLKRILEQETVIQDLQHSRDQILGPMTLLQTRVLAYNKQVQEYMKKVNQWLLTPSKEDSNEDAGGR